MITRELVLWVAQQNSPRVRRTLATRRGQRGARASGRRPAPSQAASLPEDVWRYPLAPISPCLIRLEARLSMRKLACSMTKPTGRFHSSESDKAGKFSLPRLEPGDDTAIIQASGFVSRNASVCIRPNATKDIRVKLQNESWAAGAFITGLVLMPHSGPIEGLRK